MRKKVHEIAEALRSRYIDWAEMRLKKPLRWIATEFGVHPQTVGEALRRLGLRADPQLNLHPIPYESKDLQLKEAITDA